MIVSSGFRKLISNYNKSFSAIQAIKGQNFKKLAALKTKTERMLKLAESKYSFDSYQVLKESKIDTSLSNIENTVNGFVSKTGIKTYKINLQSNSIRFLSDENKVLVSGKLADLKVIGKDYLGLDSNDFYYLFIVSYLAEEERYVLIQLYHLIRKTRDLGFN